jgi:hypothetical protein
MFSVLVSSSQPILKYRLINHFTEYLNLTNCSYNKKHVLAIILISGKLGPNHNYKFKNIKFFFWFFTISFNEVLIEIGGTVGRVVGKVERIPRLNRLVQKKNW